MRSERRPSVGQIPRVRRTQREWREQLTPTQYAVTREGATERPFTGALLRSRGLGEYRCVCCGGALFASADKYNSGCGWPSFTRPAAEAAIETREDRSFGMVRTEARCARCDAHLGHVFPDGPPEATGDRWCINSAALEFRPEEAPAPGSGGDDTAGENDDR